MVTSQRDSGNDEEEVSFIPVVSDEVYRELFALSEWVIDTEPWLEMAENRVVVIIDPETGEEQLLSVVGSDEEHFAIYLYQPEEGTRWFGEYLGDEGDRERISQRGRFENRFVSLEFCSGFDVEDHDFDLCEKFEGPDWGAKADLGMGELIGCFRGTIPWCLPWYPTEQEARKLVDALRLLRRFYQSHWEQCQEEIYADDSFFEGKICLPTFSLPKGADRSDVGQWEFSMRDYAPPPAVEMPLSVQPDPLFLAELDKFEVEPETAWEVGVAVCSRSCVAEGRLRFIAVGAVAPRESKTIQGTEMAPAGRPLEELFRRCLTTAVLSLGYLPEEIWVSSPIGGMALEGLETRFGIDIRVGERSEMSNLEAAIGEVVNVLLPPEDEDEDDDDDEYDEYDEYDVDLFGDLDIEALAAIAELLESPPSKHATKEEMDEFMGRVLAIEGASSLLDRFLEEYGADAFEDEDEDDEDEDEEGSKDEEDQRDFPF